MLHIDDLSPGWDDDLSANVTEDDYSTEEYSHLPRSALEIRVYGPRGNSILYVRDPYIAISSAANEHLISVRIPEDSNDLIIPSMRLATQLDKKQFTYIHHPCKKSNKNELPDIIQDAMADRFVFICINPESPTLLPVMDFIDKPWKKDDANTLSVEILDWDNKRMLYVHNPKSMLVQTLEGSSLILQTLGKVVVYKSGVQVQESIYKTYDPCWKGDKMYKEYDPCQKQEDNAQADQACEQCPKQSKSYAIDTTIIEHHIPRITHPNVAAAREISFKLMLACTLYLAPLMI